jgi:transcriptional regulator with XRE-family HTH domain
MRYESLRARIRQRRLAEGLSQAALAARGGTSRVTVARLETGSASDFRVETLSRLCEVLGLELVAVPRGEGSAREALLAREQERSRRLDRRRRHAILAAHLLTLRPAAATALIARARRAVDRWEREGLCSRHYTSRWRKMLAGPIGRIAGALVDPGDWTDALFQNSPWAFALPPAAE